MKKTAASSTLLLIICFTTFATSTSINDLSKRLSSGGNIRSVEPDLRAEVIEGVFANTESAILEQSYNAPRPFVSGTSDDGGELPVLNTTVAFLLPAAIEDGLTPSMRRLYRADPMWFRMLARRMVERKEKVDDLFDFLSGVNTGSSTSSSTPTLTPLANQVQIDSIVSNVESMLNNATTTRDETQAYATMVKVSLISDALILNLPVETTSSAATGESATYTYETKTTSYPAIARARALVTSYLVVVRVLETDSITSSSPTGSATVASPSSRIDVSSSSTAGAVNTERSAAAMLGLVGIAVGLAL